MRVRNWRVLTAVLAVVLAIVAGFLAWRYLDEADQRAARDFDLVPVFRASEQIPEGTSGERARAELIEEFEIPRNAVPARAVTDLADLSETAAAATISEGQVITLDSFVTPLEARGFAGTLEEGMQAISLSVDATRGVAGFVVPNDVVSVLVTLDIEQLGAAIDPETGAPIEGGDQALTTTAYLMPGVRVLAVGQTTAATQDDEETTSGILTLEVDPRQAEQIAHAAAQGSVYLALNPPGFDPDDFAQNLPDEIVEAVNWFDQELDVVAQVRAQIAGAP